MKINSTEQTHKRESCIETWEHDAVLATNLGKAGCVLRFNNGYLCKYT